MAITSIIPQVYKLNFEELGIEVGIIKFKGGKGEIHVSKINKEKFSPRKVLKNSKEIKNKIIDFARKKGIKKLMATSHLMSNKRLIKGFGFKIEKGHLIRKTIALIGQNIDLKKKGKPLNFKVKTGIIHIK